MSAVIHNCELFMFFLRFPSIYICLFANSNKVDRFTLGNTYICIMQAFKKLVFANFSLMTYIFLTADTFTDSLMDLQFHKLIS